MKRVALISTDQQALKGEEHLDTGPLNDALNASGVDSEIAIWHEPKDWSVYDAAIFRSPWDYAERTEEFMDWLGRVETRVRLINSPDLIRWNLDKRYLRELAEHGVEVVPTTFCENLEQCREALATRGSGNVVVKPNISLGSQSTGLFAATDPAALELCGSILQVGKVVLVQPAIDAIQDNAEHGLLFFNAHHSHTIQKCAILKHGGGYLGGRYTEDIRPVAPTGDEVELGNRALKAIAAIAEARGWGEDASIPLYARIDVVTPPGSHPLLLEAELFEPATFVDLADGALERFVAAIHEKLRA